MRLSGSSWQRHVALGESGRFATSARHPSIAAIAIPAVAAAVLGTWSIARPSLNGTDAITYWAAHQSFATLAHVLRHVDVVHGFYYLLMHLVFLVFGQSTWALRLPSALAGVVAVIITSLLARRLTGSHLVALVAGGMLSALPLLPDYAQSGRSYAIVTALVASSTYLLVRSTDEPQSHKRWWTYTTVVIVMVYLHEFAVFALAAHATTLLWARVDRRVLLRWLAQATVAVVAALPLIVFSSSQAGQVGYIRAANWHTAVALTKSYFGPGPVVTVLSVLLAAFAVAMQLRDRHPGLTLVSVALPLLLVPSGILLIESAVARPYYAGVRYVLYGTIGVALLIGAGLERVVRILAARVSSSPLTIGRVAVATAVVLALFLAQLPLQQRSHSVAGTSQDLLGLASYLHTHAEPGDAIIFSPSTLTAVELGYPGDLRALVQIEISESPARSGTLYGKPLPIDRFHTVLAAARRVWVISHDAKNGVSSELQFLSSHRFRRILHARFRGAVAGLYVHPPASAGRG